MRIVIYPAQSGKLWNGQTLYEEALGGSETAVVYVARELVRLGHEVIVFTRAEPGVYDDVVYIAFEKARNVLRTLPVDVLICSRDVMPFLWQHRAKITVQWFHDLPQSRPFGNPNLRAFVSLWQANLYIGNNLVSQETARVLANGVDNSIFTHKHIPKPLTPDDPVNLIWTSNPERGLWYAGDVLQRIRQVFPKAQLHVYGRNAVYGWDTGCEGNFLPDNMAGVVLHDAATKTDLATALAESDLFLYPTWWPETYCIAAVEAQAAGVPVIASQYGALAETVRGGALVPGNASMEGHLAAIADASIKTLQDDALRVTMSHRGIEYAATQDWKIRGDEWSRLLTSALMGA